MQVNWVLRIDIDSLCKILNGLIELLEPIPDQTSSIIGWRILCVYTYDLIEVFKSQLKPIPTNLLSYGTQVVESRYILGL